MNQNCIISAINKESAEYLENFQQNQLLGNEFKQSLSSVIFHSNKQAIAKHTERGKLLVRQRIDLLVDEGTSFLELSSLAAFGQWDNQFPSAGIVTGIGLVEGIQCMIVANDATVKGGTYIKETIKKHVRAQEMAIQNQLPCIYLVDSGGVYLPEQANVFPDRFDFGRVFYNQSKLSAMGLPQISIVMGSCTAGGAYVPAMSDQTIIVKNQGTIFIGGPPLVKAATGEDVSAEELGGAYVHTTISGVADYLAQDDVDAIKICRDLIAQSNQRKAPKIQSFKEPKYAIEELLGIIPITGKKVVHPHEIIARVADGSEFHEFKKSYAPNLVTGFVHICGIQAGIIANNGFLTAEAARKGTHFIELCDQRGIPLLFLQNITGFIVGKTYEHQGIARDGAKMIHAVANTGVPKITLVTGGSYGAGNYAMSGRAYDPEFLFLWPNSKTAVMGGEQAASVLQTIKNKDQQEEHPLINQFHDESTAYYSTSRLWDDGIIDPLETRKILAQALSIVTNKPINKGAFGVYRM
ncbi:MAG: methylcrotonoyl-CoA carboxylase [Bacteroidetes bacterium GWA2_40_14]|nr:MAG: methylcrotonoyl-CoA carboxylase [Bacteroidetes bacterium GWA2_40_14]HAZ02628.1 methylcrotonoyl-CoA carboxylase [Marinilabiliales bacterium]